MKFDYLSTLFALSYALDCVEHDLLGVTTNHGKRVAVLAVQMGRRCGITPGQQRELAACAVLHDCALTEYVHDEYHGAFARAMRELPGELSPHCAMGEKQLRNMPFSADIKNVILYHHENADGSGPFGRKAAEVPLFSRLIHLADVTDAVHDLSGLETEKREKVRRFLAQCRGAMFTEEGVGLLLAVLDGTDAAALSNEGIDAELTRLVPPGEMNCTPGQLMDFASVFAAITDYKSHFTCAHSMGIAQKSRRMAEYYGADDELAARLYFAGALHDIGKLAVDRDVLEKPGRLTPAEYTHIQTHAYATYEILRKIKGMEDVTRWASHHHEKLDGSGYPFGLRGDEMDRWERLLCCLDIYQALTEDRPYKKAMDRAQAMAILRHMADIGQLDADIVRDIGVVWPA